MTQSSGTQASVRAKWVFKTHCRVSTSQIMPATATKKVLVRRPSKIAADGHGRPDWIDPVESAQLELVSTQMLKAMLSSRDDADRKAIEEAADTSANGVLARDPVNGQFEIIEDNELQAILNDNQGLPEMSRPADATLEPIRDYVDDDHLSLVSTQALRKVLRNDAEQETDTAAKTPTGFNPYDAN